MYGAACSGATIDKCTGIRFVIRVILYDFARPDGLEHLLFADRAKFLQTHFIAGVAGVENVVGY